MSTSLGITKKINDSEADLPVAGKVNIYATNAGELHMKDENGVITNLTPAAALSFPTYTAENHTALTISVPAPNLNDTAYVRTSEGTKWLPGSLGGSYYPSGIYWYNGSQWISNNSEIAAQLEQLRTGWAEYVDTQYTNGSPLALTDGVKITLPNNAGTIRDTQKPQDIPTFYDEVAQEITGRNGDGLLITIEFKVRPTSAAANPRVTVSIDIGGAVGEIYTRDFVMSKGNGVTHFFVASTGAFTLDTWEGNGGAVKIIPTGSNCEVYDIRYVLTRTHKAFLP